MKKLDWENDPIALKGTEHYEHPVPNRDYLIDMIASKRSGLNFEMICQLLGLDHIDPRRDALRFRIKAMIRDGQIKRVNDGFYKKVSIRDQYTAEIGVYRDLKVIAHTNQKVAYDLLIPNKYARNLVHGDKVKVTKAGPEKSKGAQGVVQSLIKGATFTAVGRLIYRFERWYVEFKDTVCIGFVELNVQSISKKLQQQFKEDLLIEVNILERDNLEQRPQADLIRLIGSGVEPGVEVDKALSDHGIPCNWSKEVIAQVLKIEDEVLDLDKINRRDLRNLPLITIDGEDARDFDDAVYCKKRAGGGYILTVAIADVSHYVPPESPLDLEAQERGNSVYFPSCVIPMLPEKLSNGLCSLNPDVDRLCLCVDVEVSAAGNILDYSFFEGVMYSHARLTYNKVQSFIDELNESQDSKSTTIGLDKPEVAEVLQTLLSFYRVMRKKRAQRFALDFDTVETKAVFNDTGHLEKIVPVSRNDAHCLIEESMLCANVCAAMFLESHGLPGMFRNHFGPQNEKAKNLNQFIKEMNLPFKPLDEWDSKALYKLAEHVKDRDDAHVIHMTILRSMSQAVYSGDCEGHFGLCYDQYAHFTSPIRRYPDLIVHRCIRYAIRARAEYENTIKDGKPKPLNKKVWLPKSDKALNNLAEHCSMTERRADIATREAMDHLKCVYLKPKEGELFKGVITSVTNFGFFVQLEGLFVEGLIHVTALGDDYFVYREGLKHLVGERTGVTYKMGMSVSVRVAMVNISERKIDFDLASLKKVPKAKSRRPNTSKFSKKSKTKRSKRAK